MRFPRVFRLGELGPWHWILGSGVAIACLLLLSLGAWAWWSSYQSRGLAELELATLRLGAALTPQAPAEARTEAIKALEGVIERYPWLTQLPHAAYQLGNLRYQAKDFDGARKAWELALQKGTRGTLATLSRLGIGYALEAQGNHANALTAFEAARRGLTAQDFLYEEVLMSLARAHELLGQRDRAREIYSALLRDRPRGFSVEDIRARLARLSGPASP